MQKRVGLPPQSLRRLPDFQFWPPMRLVFRNKLNPHSPAGVCTDQAAKFTPSQLFAVHGDDGLSLLFYSVINQASEDVSPWSPLIAGVIFDLREAQGNFDSDVLVFGRQSSLRPERVVIQSHNLLVSHLINLWADLDRKSVV